MSAICHRALRFEGETLQMSADEVNIDAIRIRQRDTVGLLSSGPNIILYNSL